MLHLINFPNSNINFPNSTIDVHQPRRLQRCRM
jgi:hypothetical protein